MANLEEYNTPRSVENRTICISQGKHVIYVIALEEILYHLQY